MCNMDLGCLTLAGDHTYSDEISNNSFYHLSPHAGDPIYEVVFALGLIMSYHMSLGTLGRPYYIW